MKSTFSYSLETLNSGQNGLFFIPWDLEILRMTLNNKRAPLLCYFKLCASFHSHLWINKANLRDLTAGTGLVILLKLDSNRRFFARVTLKFDGWSRKIIRHVFYTTSSFVYHFRSISEFKLELQSGNAQSGSNSMIFLAVWPCNFMYDLENNRAPFLCYFKLCASFRSHWWIQTGVTVWERPIWVKIDDFF